MMHDRLPEPDLDPLLRAALAGDGRAYARFLSELAPLMRRWARTELARAGAAGLAEDVVQDALLAVHLKRGSWDPSRPVMPWLRVIVRHKAIDALRRRPTTRWDPIEVEPPDPAPVDPLAGRQVAQVLAQLPDRDAALVRGLAVEGLSETAVAERLGLSGGAMRVALHRALKKLAALTAKET